MRAIAENPGVAALPAASLVWLLAGAALLVGLTGWVAGLVPARLLTLLLVAPVAEEAVFRAGLQEALLRNHCLPWTANIATALVFGLAHAVMRHDPAAMVAVLPALLIGACYERWRQLRLCIVLHAAMNAAWIVGVTGL